MYLKLVKLMPVVRDIAVVGSRAHPMVAVWVVKVILALAVMAGITIIMMPLKVLAAAVLHMQIIQVAEVGLAVEAVVLLQQELDRRPVVVQAVVVLVMPEVLVEQVMELQVLVELDMQIIVMLKMVVIIPQVMVVSITLAVVADLMVNRICL